MLGSLLLLDVGLRLARAVPRADVPRRLASLLVPATFVVVAMSPQQRISSPNLDFATFVEVAIGMLYFAGVSNATSTLRPSPPCGALGLARHPARSGADRPSSRASVAAIGGASAGFSRAPCDWASFRRASRAGCGGWIARHAVCPAILDR